MSKYKGSSENFNFLELLTPIADTVFGLVSSCGRRQHMIMM